MNNENIKLPFNKSFIVFVILAIILLTSFYYAANYTHDAVIEELFHDKSDFHQVLIPAIGTVKPEAIQNGYNPSDYEKVWKDIEKQHMGFDEQKKVKKYYYLYEPLIEAYDYAQEYVDKSRKLSKNATTDERFEVAKLYTQAWMKLGEMKERTYHHSTKEWEVASIEIKEKREEKIPKKSDTLDDLIKRIDYGWYYKDIEVKNSKVFISTHENYEDYKKDYPDTSMSKTSFLGRFKYKEEEKVIETAAKVLMHFPEINEVDVKLYDGYTYHFNITRKQMNEHIGIEIERLSMEDGTWSHYFSSKYINDKDLRVELFNKFGSKN